MKAGAKCDHSKHSQEVITGTNGGGIWLAMAIETAVTDPVLLEKQQPGALVYSRSIMKQFQSLGTQQMRAGYTAHVLTS
jgi:hypothetical protein